MKAIAIYRMLLLMFISVGFALFLVGLVLPNIEKVRFQMWYEEHPGAYFVCWVCLVVLFESEFRNWRNGLFITGGLLVIASIVAIRAVNRHYGGKESFF